MKRVITFGIFDLFHFGHLRIIQRTKKFGDEQYVGVSSDKINFSEKKQFSFIFQGYRQAIVGYLKGITKSFSEECPELKRQYLIEYSANIVLDDWRGGFDDLGDICNVVYLVRTPDPPTIEYQQVNKNIIGSFYYV